MFSRALGSYTPEPFNLYPIITMVIYCIDLFKAGTVGDSRKTGDAYPIGAPGSYLGPRWSSASVSRCVWLFYLLYVSAKLHSVGKHCNFGSLQ